MKQPSLVTINMLQQSSEKRASPLVGLRTSGETAHQGQLILDQQIRTTVGHSEFINSTLKNIIRNAIAHKRIGDVFSDNHLVNQFWIKLNDKFGRDSDAISEALKLTCEFAQEDTLISAPENPEVTYLHRLQQEIARRIEYRIPPFDGHQIDNPPRNTDCEINLPAIDFSMSRRAFNLIGIATAILASGSNPLVAAATMPQLDRLTFIQLSELSREGLVRQALRYYPDNFGECFEYHSKLFQYFALQSVTAAHRGLIECFNQNPEALFNATQKLFSVVSLRHRNLGEDLISMRESNQINRIGYNTTYIATTAGELLLKTFQEELGVSQNNVVKIDPPLQKWYSSLETLAQHISELTVQQASGLMLRHLGVKTHDRGPRFKEQIDPATFEYDPRSNFDTQIREQNDKLRNLNHRIEERAYATSILYNVLNDPDLTAQQQEAIRELAAFKVEAIEKDLKPLNQELEAEFSLLQLYAQLAEMQHEISTIMS